MSEGSLKDEGWGFPANARKCHYFAAGSSFSLCGKWGFFFGRIDPDTGIEGPDDCKACTKELIRFGRHAAVSVGEEEQ